MRRIFCPLATELTAFDDDGRHVGSAILLTDGWRVICRRNVVCEEATREEAESLLTMYGAQMIHESEGVKL